MPSRLERVATAHRRALRDLETDALRPVVGAYQDAISRLTDEIDVVSSLVAQARQDGTSVNAGWLYRQARARQLLESTELAFSQYAEQVGAVLTPAQRQAVRMATDAGRDLIAAGLPEAPGLFAPSVNRAAVEHLVGNLQPGSPLRNVLDTYGLAASDVVREELLYGGIGSESPRVVAGRIADRLGGEMLTRAMTLTRTELLRSARESTRATYQANRHLVKAWRWLATLDRRTCPACWAMNGEVFPLEVPMGNHVSCRCALTPVMVDRYAIPGGKSGAEVFAEQSADVQRDVLGPAAYAAYRRGDIQLTDLVQVTHDPVWGVSRTVKPLSRALREGRRAA